MHQEPKLTNEEKRKRVAQWIWLGYYNEFLFQKGLITEDTRNHMKVKIDRVCQF